MMTNITHSYSIEFYHVHARLALPFAQKGNAQLPYLMIPKHYL